MANCPMCAAEHHHYHIDELSGLEKYVRWCPKHCILCKLEEDEKNDASYRDCLE